MASIWKHPESKFWVACFTGPDGRRMKRSTKTTNRRQAIKLSFKYEEAAGKKLTKKAARQVIGDLYEMVSGEKLPGQTARLFLTEWVYLKKSLVAEGTWRKYSDEVKRFLGSLGIKADMDISTINRADVYAFQVSMAGRLSVGTANLGLKIIRIALNDAKRNGLIDSNPAEEVKVLSKKDVEQVRRPFTLPELKRLLDLADDEWKGMILFGFYTGQRLQDIALANWQSIDLVKKKWSFVTIKTNQRKSLPLAEPLIKHLMTSGDLDNPKKPVFPRIAASIDKTGRVGQVSNEFHDLLVAAGLLAARSKQSTGKGRGARRQQNELSFHCLRHTNNSLLKQAGVPESVVMAFVGHDTPEVSALYTHVDEESLADAATKLPDILM
jgi:integrase